VRKVQLLVMTSALAWVGLFQEKVFAQFFCVVENPTSLLCAEAEGNVYCENNVEDGFAQAACEQACDNLQLPYVDFYCDNGSQSDVLDCWCSLS
jgi:hypothetical protein